MFERFCALLLRLYPAEFRRVYGDEAVRLMKDRASHERGVFQRVRLLIDLASDLGAISLRGWHRREPLLRRSDDAPRFDSIEVHGPRPEALVVGVLTSTLMFTAFALLLIQEKPLTAATNAPHAPARLGGRAGAGAGTSAADSNDSGGRGVAADAEARHQLIAAIAANLRQRYVDRAIGRRLADALVEHDKNGDYTSLAMGAHLAARLNWDILIASRSLDVPRGVMVADVVYRAQPLPAVLASPITEDIRARQRAMMLLQNCLVETVEMRPHHVGYLKLTGFGEATTCRETTAKAMASLNDAEALIIDVRDNVGGYGDTALQIAGYLFDRPTFMYDPRPHSPVPARTVSPISGNKLADKPVYVLTSSRTQSAAEYFVYNLKMLKRATVVGETTAGRQHSGAFLRIDDHFGMGIQDTTRPENPYAVKGWELIGIEPDVKVSRIDAFDAAKQLAESRASRTPAVAQSRALAFETISIKTAASGDPRGMRMRVLANGDLSASAVPVLLLLRYAYDVPINAGPRLSGLPGWREIYDIEAKAPANAVRADLPEGERRGRMQAMLRGLLADRFKLVMRAEQKTMPAYALTVASGGPHLQKSSVADKDCLLDTGNPDGCHDFLVGRGHPLNAKAITMDDLAQYIENWTDMPVVNRTALSGLFAVETEGWKPMRLPPPPPGAPAAMFDDLPTIFTVLRTLGLELKQQEATVPVYTVEHIERPAGSGLP